jgi:hypothetical protein
MDCQLHLKEKAGGWDVYPRTVHGQPSPTAVALVTHWLNTTLVSQIVEKGEEGGWALRVNPCRNPILGPCMARLLLPEFTVTCRRSGSGYSLGDSQLAEPEIPCMGSHWLVKDI